jgi:hypothetical protein
MNTMTVESSALASFDEPTETGPAATERLEIEADNRSATGYTQAGNNAYQLFFNYVVRDLRILEKIRRGIPLNDNERRLAEDLGLARRERLKVPPEEDPLYGPDLEGKVLKGTNAEVATVNINSTGQDNGVSLVSLRPRDGEVIYVTGVSINGQNFSSSDGLLVGFDRNKAADFYQLDTYGLPSNPYKADLHIPVLDTVEVEVFASSTLTGVDVTLEYAKVERSLLEKAIHGLENEVKANDDLARRRTALFEKIRRRLRAGLPIEEGDMVEATASDMSESPRRA